MQDDVDNAPHRGAVKWLEDLEFVSRKPQWKSGDIFTVRKKGKTILAKLKSSPTNI
jgi:hypothetical protein